MSFRRLATATCFPLLTSEIQVLIFLLLID
jgi:hypothetical protein